MTRGRFEAGAYRAYCAAWLLFSGFYLSVFGYQVLSAPPPQDAQEIAQVVAIFLAFLAGPWIAMRLVRWVYRGFVPLP